MLGTYALSAGYYDAYYLKAQKVRTLIKRRLRRACGRRASMPWSRRPRRRVAFRFGARLADPVAMYLSDACTLPVNMAGLPGVSIPCGPVRGPAGRAAAHRRGLVRGELFGLARGLRGDHAPAPTGAASSPPSLAARRTDPDPADARASERAALARRAAADDRPQPTPRAPLAERALARARPRRAAVGDPAVLRHPRDDGRRHQPRGGGAGLRHAAGDRRGRRRVAARGPDPLHLELRDARAAAGARRATSSAATASRYDPATELLITVGASEAVDLALRATCDPGDEVILHEPSYVAYVPAIVFAGGVAAPRRDPLRGRLRARPGRGRGGDHAADEGAVPRLPVQPDRRGPARTTVQDELAAIAERHDLLVYSDEIYDRLAYGAYRHRAFSALPGMRERTILMGGFSKAYAMTGWRVG